MAGKTKKEVAIDNIKKSLSNDLATANQTPLECLTKYLFDVVKLTATQKIQPEVLAKYLIEKKEFEDDIIANIAAGKDGFVSANDIIGSITGMLKAIINNYIPQQQIILSGIDEQTFNNHVSQIISKYIIPANIDTNHVRKFLASKIHKISELLARITVLKNVEELVDIIADLEKSVIDTNSVPDDTFNNIYTVSKDVIDNNIKGIANEQEKDNLFVIVLDFILDSANTITNINSNQSIILRYIMLIYSKVIDFDDIVEKYLLFDEDKTNRLFESSFEEGTKYILENLKSNPIVNGEDDKLILYIVSSIIFGQIDFNNIDLSFKYLDDLLTTIFTGVGFKFTSDELLN